MLKKLQSFYIILRSSLIVLLNSLAVIFLSYFVNGMKLRHRIDYLDQRWARKVLKVVGASCEVVNLDNFKPIPGRPCIVMSNHASLYDIPIILATLPGSIRMIAKKELFRIPFWGRAMRLAEFVSMDRADRKGALEGLKQTKERLLSGIIPWVAPEGTRTRTGELLPFKKGGFLLALQTDAIILPVAILGSAKILPADSLDFHLGEKIKVKVGHAIDSKDYSVRDLSKMMQAVRTEIETALQEY